MTKIKKERLIEVAEDLQEILGLKDPPMNTTVEEQQLEFDIREAAELLDVNDDFAKGTIEVLQELFVDSHDELDEDIIEVFTQLGILDEKALKKEKKTKVEKPDKADDDKTNDGLKWVHEELWKEIEDADRLADLKAIVKNNDGFKTLRSQLSRYKVKKELRKDMLAILRESKVASEEPTYEPAIKEAPAIKEEVKKPVEKEEKKIEPVKEKRVKPVAKEEKSEKVKSMTRAGIFAGMLHENIPRTMNELVDEMMERYHSNSITGAKTFVSMYISILKEMGLIEKNEKGQYMNVA